uniref:Uncharacterized protein n=1 Tax=Solanum lycopersicum TaxID=4081 RepID=A0A3Q7IYX6_SOLLC
MPIIQYLYLSPIKKEATYIISNFAARITVSSVVDAIIPRRSDRIANLSEINLPNFSVYPVNVQLIIISAKNPYFVGDVVSTVLKTKKSFVLVDSTLVHLRFLDEKIGGMILIFKEIEPFNSSLRAYTLNIPRECINHGYHWGRVRITSKGMVILEENLLSFSLILLTSSTFILTRGLSFTSITGVNICSLYLTTFVCPFFIYNIWVPSVPLSDSLVVASFLGMLELSSTSSKVDLYFNFSSSRPSLGASGFIHDKRRTNRDFGLWERGKRIFAMRDRGLHTIVGGTVVP